MSQSREVKHSLEKSGPARRFLVTGGAGFLGSHLCDRLIARGDRVLCLDNFRSGSHENIAHLSDSSDFQMLCHDITNSLPFGDNEDIDGIFNLACPASPPDYQRDPIGTFKASIWGGANVLELARRYGIPVLHTSTSEVYGDPHISVQPETYWGNVNPIGIRACYDEGKRGAETLFFDYQRVFGTQIRVVRLFNTYGPRLKLDDGRVVSNFIVQALRGDDITVYGDGSQTRSFCYVDDTIEALLRMMDCPQGADGPVNIGNPVEITVSELANFIIAATKSRSSIVHRPLPHDDPKQRRPDIYLANKILGWEPEVSLDQGLMRTIEYFLRKIESGTSRDLYI
ncbi:UDP-glucuronic acid decarboxylase family protein [Fodinicurvata sp. EGI_FJ10296]|uniref:UDP-glucuronic acid decarboxylase family protein n=1 Tax=Fodinicurvata sp. EGI_FJ10296 TaxID=3231908 RepID=UPI0034531D3C